MTLQTRKPAVRCGLLGGLFFSLSDQVPLQRSLMTKTAPSPAMKCRNTCKTHNFTGESLSSPQHLVIVTKDIMQP